MNSTTEDKPFDSKAFLKNLTSRPGVYRMYDAADQVIYVGKARNLKKTRLQLLPETRQQPQDPGVSEQHSTHRGHSYPY